MRPVPLFLIATIFLSACGGGGSSSNDAENPAAPGEPVVPVEPGFAARNVRVELVYDPLLEGNLYPPTFHSTIVVDGVSSDVWLVPPNHSIPLLLKIIDETGQDPFEYIRPYLTVTTQDHIYTPALQDITDILFPDHHFHLNTNHYGHAVRHSGMNYTVNEANFDLSEPAVPLFFEIRIEPPLGVDLDLTDNIARIFFLLDIPEDDPEDV